MSLRLCSEPTDCDLVAAVIATEVRPTSLKVRALSLLRAPRGELTEQGETDLAVIEVVKGELHPEP